MYQQNRKCSVQFDAIFIEYMCPRAPFFFFASQRHLDHIVPTASGVDSRGTVDGEEVHQVLCALFPLPTASWWAADGSTPPGSSHPGSTLL
jgi:hypothetical protein